MPLVEKPNADVRHRLITNRVRDVSVVRECIDDWYRKGKSHPVVASALAYAAILFVVYVPIFTGQKSLKTIGSWPPGPLFVSDPEAGGPITFPMEQWALRAWAHWHLPTWFPTEGYGMTLGGNQGAPWFLPEILAHLLFPHDFSIWNVVRMFIAAVGTYLLATELEIPPGGAFVAGLIMVLTGPIPANINLEMVNPLMVLPYLCVVTLRTLRAKMKRELILFASLVAICIDASCLAGFDEVLPLECILVGVLLVAWLVHHSRSIVFARNRLLVLAGAAAAGVLGSLVATVSLLRPLSTYFTYQSPYSYLSNSYKMWLATLLAPNFFGNQLSAGPYEMGQSIWAFGNPVVWVLAFTALSALLLTKNCRSVRWWALPFAGIVAFGVMGFVNLFHVLAVFRLPPFNLIVMVRFLPFLWWLPLALLAGAGFSAIKDLSKKYVAIGWGLVLGSLAVPLAILAVRQTTVAGLLQQSVGAYLFVLALAFVCATIVALVPNRRATQYALGALLLFSTLYYIPKNFFPAKSPNRHLFATVKSLAGPGGLVYFAAFDSAETWAMAERIRTVQAFGPFYPRSYANALAGLFPENSEGGALFFAAPTLSSEAESFSSASSPVMRYLGVSVVVSPTRLPPNLRVTVPGSWRFPHGELDPAVKQLAAVYDSRGDLQKAFPVGSSDFSFQLLDWTVHYGITIDSAKPELYRYRVIYRILWNDLQKRPQTPVFRVLRSSVPVVVKGQGMPMYIYRFGPSREIWAPEKFQVASSTMVEGLLRRGRFSKLLDVAYLSPRADMIDPRESTPPRVQINRYVNGTDTETLSAVSSKSGWVVLRNQYTPNMTVSVNGERTPALPVDNSLWVAVHIKKGADAIALRYDTQSAAWWVSLGVSGLLVLIALWQGLITSLLLNRRLSYAGKRIVEHGN